MKKETPRLLKSASIVYAFDCFGTIFSSVPVFKFLKRNVCSFHPNDCNIRWVLIVPDSRWYLLKARVLCFINGLAPSQFIKCPNWKLKSKDVEPIIKLLQDIHDQKDIITYVDPKKVKKVIYINNDLKKDDSVNQSIDRLSYDIVAVNLMDFWQNKFSHLM